MLGASTDVSQPFAAGLNAGIRPFHVINYVGSLGGARVWPRRHGAALRPHRQQPAGFLAGAKRSRPGTRNAFSVGWDPGFRDCMTLADVYPYATQHCRHHRPDRVVPPRAAAEAERPDRQLAHVDERRNHRTKARAPQKSSSSKLTEPLTPTW